MRIHHRSFHACVALFTAGSVLFSPVAPLIAQTAKPAATPAKSPAAAATNAVATPTDGGWPKDYVTSSGGALRVFQPQIASWDGQRKIVALSAVSFIPKGASKQTMGTVKFEGDTSVAVDQRLVNFSNVKVSESSFQNAPTDQVKEITGEIVNQVPKDGLVIGLDRVLARLDKSTIIPKNVAEVKADPPPIFYSTTPAILVNIDSDPIWSPIMGNDLKFAVNTNWDLFQDSQTNTYYLRHDETWYSTTDLKGTWKPAGKLPENFKKLPEDNGNWKEVKDSLPGKSIKESKMPKVFVSTMPAEMILLRGEPNYLTVGKTSLLWVSNTDSDVFRMGKTGPVYTLFSGRWFSAPDFVGPWTFATLSLPPEFKEIPLSHERSRVLASVPGTDQAAEAVLIAQIPQIATVNKKQIKAPEVEYDGGMPQFQPIEKTNLQRAANTDKDIIKVGDLYYMCFQGVWFMGKSPTGPWEATGSVPGEIYTIPASSPSHNVTYVTVQEDKDDTAVYVAAAAYTGMMIAWGCVVWGSGWYYPPYYGYGGFYPYYRPYYPTYGGFASYNPWSGAYTRGAVAYGPYGGAGVAARYNPRTGTYSRGAAAWGPYGGRGAASAYNPRTGAVGATRQGSNVYGSWGSTAVARGDQWASTSRVTNNRTGATTRVTQGSGGGEAITRNAAGPGGSGVARTGSGDVYAGRDGNVYKKDAGGGWSEVNGGARPNTATAGELNRDSAARAEGARRTNDYSSAGRTGSSSYRPSSGGSRSYGGGGASRGGGGGRRR